MRIFIRRSQVDFSTIFLDSEGNPPATPTSATVTITYPPIGGQPATSWPWQSGLEWPLSGETLTTATLALTGQTDGSWTGVWDSSVSAPGVVYWHSEADTSGLSCEEGQFRLRANPAGLTLNP